MSRTTRRRASRSEFLPLNDIPDDRSATEVPDDGPPPDEGPDASPAQDRRPPDPLAAMRASAQTAGPAASILE